MARRTPTSCHTWNNKAFFRRAEMADTTSGIENIWVYAEAENGQVSSTTQELLAKARELAATVTCFYGGDPEEVATELGSHGADIVYGTGDLEDQLQGPAVASAIRQEVEASGAPAAYLFGTTYAGRDVAARLSVKLDSPVISNIVNLALDAEASADIGGGGLVGVSSIMGGEMEVRSGFSAAKNNIFLVRPKSFDASAVDSNPAEVRALTVPDLQAAGGATITERVVDADTGGPKLTEAAIVVAGGRGLGSAEHFSLVDDVAGQLGAAVGATRAIVDAGWVPYAYQIGQTGQVVKPDVYIACGISGATQHVAGMKGSKNIIAIDTDPEAPIFKLADLGIVGDVHQILPKLVDALKSR